MEWIEKLKKKKQREGVVTIPHYYDHLEGCGCTRGRHSFLAAEACRSWHAKFTRNNSTWVTTHVECGKEIA